MSVPKPPADLKSRGRGARFWRGVLAEYDCSAVELELLTEAGRLLDELDVLRAAVAKDGPLVAGSRQQVRAHPALGELRQARGELRRLLDALNIPAPAAAADDDVEVPSLTSRRAHKAATARWAGRGARHAP